MLAVPLHGSHEIWNKIRSALILILHIRPRLIYILLLANHRVVRREAPHCEHDKSTYHYPLGHPAATGSLSLLAGISIIVIKSHNSLFVGMHHGASCYQIRRSSELRLT